MVFPMIIFNNVNKGEFVLLVSSIFTCFQQFFALLDYDISELFSFVCVYVCAGL